MPGKNSTPVSFVKNNSGWKESYSFTLKISTKKKTFTNVRLVGRLSIWNWASKNMWKVSMESKFKFTPVASVLCLSNHSKECNITWKQPMWTPKLTSVMSAIFKPILKIWWWNTRKGCILCKQWLLKLRLMTMLWILMKLTTMIKSMKFLKRKIENVSWEKKTIMLLLNKISDLTKNYLIFFSFSFFSNMDQDVNLWDVSHLNEFLQYCCPECSHYHEPNKHVFIQHAISVHPKVIFNHFINLWWVFCC